MDHWWTFDIKKFATQKQLNFLSWVDLKFWVSDYGTDMKNTTSSSLFLQYINKRTNTWIVIVKLISSHF
jgi:hypothetical protein